MSRTKQNAVFSHSAYGDPQNNNFPMPFVRQSQKLIGLFLIIIKMIKVQISKVECIKIQKLVNMSMQ